MDELAVGPLRWLGLHRIIEAPPTTVTYFDHVALLNDPAKVKAGRAAVSVQERSLDQLVAISRIARGKYVLIRRAVAFLGVGMSLLLIAAIAGRQWHSPAI